MTLLSQADIIRAGDSNSTPARDFIVQAGNSSTATRDFIVKYIKYVLGLDPLALGVASGSNNTWDGVPSQVEVLSGQADFLQTLRRLELTSLALQLSSSPIDIYQVDLVLGAIEVRSGSNSFFEYPISTVQVLSSTSQVFRVNLGSSLIQISSSYEVVTGIPPVQVEVSSSATDFSYKFRIWTVITHLLSVTGSIQVWPLPSVGVQCSNPAVNFRYLVRSWQVQTHVIGVSSSTTNIIPINTACLPLGVSSSNANLRLDRSMVLPPSTITVLGSLTNIRDSTIRAQTSTLGVSSGFADFRFLSSGFLPAVAPSTRVFVSNNYAVIKTNTMAGRTVRRLMASRPVNASLTLEYLNVTDSEAEHVVAAFHQSYGTYYGFTLPALITEGGSSELSNYIHSANNNLKWFFDAPPRVESIFKGISNIQIQLTVRTTST